MMRRRAPRNGGAHSPPLIRPAIPQSAHSRLSSCAQRTPHVPLTWPGACIITNKIYIKILPNELTQEYQKLAHAKRDLFFRVTPKRKKEKKSSHLSLLPVLNAPFHFMCDPLQCPYALHSTSRCGLSSFRFQFYHCHMGDHPTREVKMKFQIEEPPSFFPSSTSLPKKKKS